MNVAYLCLGGNMGDREFYLKQAIEQIDLKIGPILSVSSIYETQAWGVDTQDAYLNACVKLSTNDNAHELMTNILLIEQELGRKRDANNQYLARVIDIDILFFNNDVIELPDLIVPHPRLHLRKFVLLPLLDIARDVTHPVLKLPIASIVNNCKDDLTVKLFKLNL